MAHLCRFLAMQPRSFVLALGLLSSSCNQSFVESEREFYHLSNGDSLQMPKHFSETLFTFSNRSEETISFWFVDSGGHDFSSSSALVKPILAQNSSDAAIAMALWKLVCESGGHEDFSMAHTLHDNTLPLSLMRYPGFMCGEKAGILAHLAHTAGLPSRVVGLKRHVVTEIFHDEQWHMYDADMNRIHMNENGHVASVHELHTNSRLLDDDFKIEHFSGAYLSIFPYRSYFGPSAPTLFDIDPFTNLQCSPVELIFDLQPSDEISFKVIRKSRWKRLVSRSVRQFDVEMTLYRTIAVNDMANPDSAEEGVLFTLPFHLQELGLTLKSKQEKPVQITFKGCQSETGIEKRSAVTLAPSERSAKLTFDSFSGGEIFYEWQLYATASAASEDSVQIEARYMLNGLICPLATEAPVIFMISSATDSAVLPLQLQIR